MSEPKKLGFDFSNVRLYTWQNLWWYNDEIDVGFNAILQLIDNQEKSLKESLEFAKNFKHERLPQIPEEYRASYEQQFFEDTDKVNYQLSIMQRYSSCIMIFSFFENILTYLASEIADEINLTFVVPNRRMIPETVRFLVNSCGVNASLRTKEYTAILQQRVIRDSMVHHRGIIPNERVNQFVPMDGIKLKNREIIITPEYLKSIIKIGKKFFDDLILLIDDRFCELAKQN